MARRYRRVRTATWLAVAWVVLATFGAILLSLNRNLGVYFRGEPLMFAALGVTVTTFMLWLSWRAARDPHWLARRIEDRFPQLDARLLTAIEQVPELPDGRYGYLQQELIQEALFHGYHNDWRRALPAWRTPPHSRRAASRLAPSRSLRWDYFVSHAPPSWDLHFAGTVDECIAAAHETAGRRARRRVDRTRHESAGVGQVRWQTAGCLRPLAEQRGEGRIRSGVHAPQPG